MGLARKVPVRPQVSLYEICGGHSGTWTGSCPTTAVFPVNIIPPRLHTYFHLGTNAAPTRPTNEQCSFGSRGVLYSKNWHFVKRQTSRIYSNKSLWQHTIRTRYPKILNRAHQLQKTTLAYMRMKSKLLCWHKKYKWSSLISFRIALLFSPRQLSQNKNGIRLVKRHN